MRYNLLLHFITMRYLITTSKYEPFYTDWYGSDMFNAELDMVVYDLTNSIYTKDGVTWNDIIYDNL